MLPQLPPKRRGELAELAFMLKATQMGLVVSKPYGDSFPFDFVVLGGRLLSRIQVRSVSKPHNKGGYFQIPMHRCQGGGLVPYTAADVDFIVVYLLCEDSWYVFPPAVFTGRKTIMIHPTARADKLLHRQYRDRWDLLFSPNPSHTVDLQAAADPLWTVSPWGALLNLSS